MYYTNLIANITFTLYAFSDIYNILSYGRIKTYIELNSSLNSSSNKHLTIISGDFISPTKYTNIDNGQTIIKAFNLVPVDISSIGNHEFDINSDKLNSSLDLGIKTKFISTNIEYISNTVKYHIYNHIDKLNDINITFGFIGLCGDNFYHKYDIKFNTDNEINQTINHIQNYYNPDYIIGLTHATLEDDYIFIDKFPQIDIILGGHIHTFDYSKYKGVPIIRTGENADSLFKIDFFSSKSFKINLIDITKMEIHPDIYNLYLEGEKNFESFNKEPLFYFNSTYSNINPRTTQETLPTLICSLTTSYFETNFTLINSGGFKLNGEEFTGMFSVGKFIELMPFNDLMIVVCMNKTDLINGIMYSITNHYGGGGFLQSDINLNNLTLYKFQDKIYVSITLLMIKGIDANPFFTKYYNPNYNYYDNGMYIQNIIFKFKNSTW